MDIFNLRREFEKKTLDENDISQHPIQQFEKWFTEALQSEVLEPNAMTLSTCGYNGRISSRIVLLKQVNESGFVFFTNYNSHKAMQLKQNQFCALNFMWHELERQIRIEGVAEFVSAEDSDLYFNQRPTESKLGAWASPQSAVIPDRNYLNGQLVRLKEKFKDSDILRPSNWGGYLIKPLLIEFWQGRENRLHDRIQYKQEDERWVIERLAP